MAGQGGEGAKGAPAGNLYLSIDVGREGGREGGGEGSGGGGRVRRIV
jgi:hypothetical protein